MKTNSSYIPDNDPNESFEVVWYPTAKQAEEDKGSWELIAHDQNKNNAERLAGDSPNTRLWDNNTSSWYRRS